jgi:hypothetical protein
MHGLNKMYFSNPGCSRALYEPELNLIEVFASVLLPRALPENGSTQRLLSFSVKTASNLKSL